MSTSISASTLSATGLTDEQREHFTEHGWVVLESVLSADACELYIESVDHTLAKLAQPESDDRYGGKRHGFPEPHLCDSRFVDIYEIPGLLESAVQLIGFNDIRYANSLVACTWPSTGDEARLAELADPSTFGWHRDLPPRWNVFPAPDDSRFITSSIVTMAVFFTPASQEDGATAFLDGSHRIEGDWRTTPAVWEALRDRCPIVYPTAPAGSILLFSESLVHSAVHVFSDQRRVCMFSWFDAPWMSGDHGKPPHMIERFSNERMRSFFQGPEAGAYFAGLDELEKETAEKAS